MVIGKAFFFPCRAGGRTSRVTCLTVILAALLGLAACNPVETWRDWSGASKNDPDPETTPNTQNLAAGEAGDYPNLATVPPPPVRALTVAEREKLTQSLIADRTNAKYSAEKLVAGSGAMPGAAPPPPPPPIPAPGDETQTNPDGGAKPPAPAAQPAATTGSGDAPTPAASDRPGEKTTAAGQGLRKAGEPPEPPPMESSLEVPQVRSTPHPEQVQTASPPPYPTPAPTVANASPPTPRLASPPAPVALPSAIGSTAYQAPPPPPVMAPLATNASPKPVPPPVGAPVAEIKFTADSTSLSQDDRQTIEKVAMLYQQNPGKVRIVGYAGAGGGAAEQLNSFRAALDRAQAVAAALTEAGIPSGKIAVEAAPSDASAVESRAEVMLEH
jgi:outer membrane protein OmpA-like peptidoglycan-associated protein